MVKRRAEPGTLTLSRTFNAGRERVFSAWADPNLLERWWAPPGFKMDHAEIDLRPGGCFRIGMTAPDGSRIFAVGMLEEVRRPERLVFGWSWEGWDPGGPDRIGATRVTVEFHEKERSTEVVLTHEGFPSAEIAREHERGWRECLERIGHVVQ